MPKKTDTIATTDMTAQGMKGDSLLSPSAIPAAVESLVAEAPVFRASTQVSDRLSPPWGQTINERELMSIYALLAYVAHNQNVRQDLVQMVVEAQFGVDNISKIRREDYERAVAFLVDLRIDELMN